VLRIELGCIVVESTLPRKTARWSGGRSQMKRPRPTVKEFENIASTARTEETQKGYTGKLGQPSEEILKERLINQLMQEIMVCQGNCV
jgi:hypothetical protein